MGFSRSRVSIIINSIVYIISHEVMEVYETWQHFIETPELVGCDGLSGKLKLLVLDSCARPFALA